MDLFSVIYNDGAFLQIKESRQGILVPNGSSLGIASVEGTESN